MATVLALLCPARALRAGWCRALVGHRSWTPTRNDPAPITPDRLAPTGADLDDWPGWADYQPAYPGFDPLRAT